MSDEFKVTRGLRQGDPLSCTLFLYLVEVLALKIRQEEDIEGIKIGKEGEKKLGQYADDIWVSMKHQEKGYRASHQIFTEFEAFAGLKINYNKTEVLRIGSLYITDAKYYSEMPLFWTDGPIKILGIWCCTNEEKMCQKNFQSPMIKTSGICNVWKNRSLTLLVKIQVVNTLIIPLFVY